MPLDLTGIQNIGEFYSHHYLDALLENDLKRLFAKWRAVRGQRGWRSRSMKWKVCINSAASG